MGVTHITIDQEEAVADGIDALQAHGILLSDINKLKSAGISTNFDKD